MNAAGLVQLAAARGIDLAHVAGVASDLHGAGRKRALSADERKQGLSEVSLTANGRETKNSRRPPWSVAELGQAAHGLSEVPWAAAMYSFAGSEKGYWLLWDALVQRALKLARRDRWALRVEAENGQRTFYRDQLCALVLDHDANQDMFAAAPSLFGLYMGVPVDIWERDLDGPFRSLKDVYAGWLRTAQLAIGRRIREP